MVDVEAVQQSHRTGFRELFRKVAKSNGVYGFMRIQRAQNHFQVRATHHSLVNHIEATFKQGLRKGLASGAQRAQVPGKLQVYFRAL